MNLKRNRIICSEVAVNEQFFPGESIRNFKLPEKKWKFFENLLEKMEIFCDIAWKNQNFVDPDPRPPRFQNQIDATATFNSRDPKEIRSIDEI